MGSATRARLRTKTGCLDCRQRRKKCDERDPVCGGCRLSGRDCRWPTQEDLVDRRFTSHGRSRHRSAGQSAAGAGTATATPEPVDSRVGRSTEVVLIKSHRSTTKRDARNLAHMALDPVRSLLFESAAAHGVIYRDLELVLSRHFVQRYYTLLLLPRCHPSFYDGWLAEIQRLMASQKSLYYSVMACAASHLHFIDASPRMGDLSMAYYTAALGQLISFLANCGKDGVACENGLLMSVMLLYLHGSMGCSTYADIPLHLNAAIRILNLRLLDDGSHRERANVIPLFDRLAVESVLYQIFLVTTGRWSGSPAVESERKYEINPEFWAKAENLLDRSTLFPGFSRSLNSPVLGIPVPLFRLALSLSQLCQGRATADPQALEQLRSEVEHWELVLLLDQYDVADYAEESDQCNDREVHYKDVNCLYAIAASLMMGQLTRHGAGIGRVEAEPGQSWQTRKALEILERHQGDEGWATCFIGDWPVYTIGFFVQAPEDRRAVREDLERRWNLTRFAQFSRCSRDLEKVWSERDAAAASSGLLMTLQ